jgi:ADP-dependent NAD(P)H-hydrate dehydratase / NAD(P)H-hydrate epimerase
MERTYWYRQEPDKPLFADLLWSRPENKAHAGKLLIVGGNMHGFAAPAEAYGAAMAAGIGTARVLLPLAVKKAAGNLLPDLEYSASTPSGSFAQAALGELTEHGRWADSVLFAGDLGHNSETAILLEKYLTDYKHLICLTQDAADYCLSLSEMILNRLDTLLVLTMAQLQKLAISVGHDKPFTLGMDLLRLTENLHEFTLRYVPHIIVRHGNQILIATAGKVCSTQLKDETSQNPNKPFEALTTAVHEYSKNDS